MKKAYLLLASFFPAILLLPVSSLLAVTEHDTGWFQETCTGAEFKITKIHEAPAN
jgi:hypothetical protein